MEKSCFSKHHGLWVIRMTDTGKSATERVVPVDVIEKFVQNKKEYADFIETTSAPDGVASEVRDCALELEKLVEKEAVKTEGSDDE